MADVKLQIDREFRGLMRELSEEEFAGLEAEIVSDGRVRDPIVYWMETGSTKALVIDGMNRLEIATKHNLKYPSAAKHFKTRQEAKVWIVQHQFNRRNLTEGQRAMYAAKLTALRNGQPQQENGEPHDEESSEKASVDAAAAMAGVSPRSVEMARKVVHEGVKELSRAVESGEVSMSAAAAIADLPDEEQKKLVKAGPEAIREHATKRRRREAKKREAAKETVAEKSKTMAQLFSDVVDQLGRTTRAVDAFWKGTDNDKKSRDEVVDALSMARKDMDAWKKRLQKSAK